MLINEVLPVPKKIDWNDDGTRDEGDAWVELYNPTDEAVDLSFWTLDADRSEQVAYRIPIRDHHRTQGLSHALHQ